jgi:hypothetical protein
LHVPYMVMNDWDVHLWHRWTRSSNGDGVRCHLKFSALSVKRGLARCVALGLAAGARQLVACAQTM